MEEEEEGKSAPEELTCPQWMMTMGDCMSLLLTFFVLLLTFSTTSKSRLMDVIGVIKETIDIRDYYKEKIHNKNFKSSRGIGTE